MAEQQSLIPIPSADIDDRTVDRSNPASRQISSIARAMSAIRSTTLVQRFLIVILVVFVAKGIVITFVHPPFTGHDEVAHYAYLRFVAEEHRLPVIPDWNQWEQEWNATGREIHDQLPKELWEYCRYTTKEWSLNCSMNAAPTAFDLGPRRGPMGWVYTANHPPLYYVIMSPVYWLTEHTSPESQLYAIRLAAIPFGLLTILFAYLTVRTLFPRDQFLAMMVPAFVVFQPQIAYESAMLNNDILAIVCSSAVIYFLSVGLKRRFPLRICLLIGFSFGLAMLAKNTSAVSAGIIAFAMILGLGVRNWRQWLSRGSISAFTASLIVWPWFLYMYRTYGDFTALGRISELQHWNYRSGRTPSIWDQFSSRNFVWSRWHETWGAFGWRLIYLSSDLMRVLLWFILIGTIGIGVWSWRFWQVQKPILREDDPARATNLRARADSVFDLERWQVIGILTMGVACLISYYAILQFGTTFALTQARYYFTAIVPAAILLMLGVRSLFPKRILHFAQTGLFVAMVGLTLVIYTGYVIPYWASKGKLFVHLDPFYR